VKQQPGGERGGPRAPVPQQDDEACLDRDRPVRRDVRDDGRRGKLSGQREAHEIGQPGRERDRGAVAPRLAGELAPDRGDVHDGDLDLDQPQRPGADDWCGVGAAPACTAPVERERGARGGECEVEREQPQQRVAAVEHVRVRAGQRRERDEHDGRAAAAVRAHQQTDRRADQRDVQRADRERRVARVEHRPLEPVAVRLHRTDDALRAIEGAEIRGERQGPAQDDRRERDPDRCERRRVHRREPEAVPAAPQPSRHGRRSSSRAR
jgi:hypothetical protein